jgi:flagellar hook-length control protein FliK
VQLETTTLGLTLPEPSPASLGESRSQTSFDDHLQQARRQEERSPRPDVQPTRDEVPAERSQSTSQESTAAEQAPAEDSAPRETTDDTSANDGPQANSEHEEAESAHEDAALGADVPAELAQSLTPADQVVVCSGVIDALATCGASMPLPSQRGPASIAAAAASGPAMDDAPEGLDAAEPGADDERPQSPAHRLRVQPTKLLGLPTEIQGQQVSDSAASASGPEIQTAMAVDGEARAPITDLGDTNHESPGETPTFRPASPAVLALGIDTASNVTGSSPEPADGVSGVQASSEQAPPSHEQTETAVQRAETATQPVAAAGEGATAKAPNFLLPGRGAQRAPGAQQLSDAERTRLVQRVARALETAGEGGQMRLRLSPPELGSLRLDVSVRHGVLTAYVEAETPQARMLLLDNLPALRERLQEQNVKIERFDVDLMNQPSGGQPQGYRQRDQNPPAEPAHQSGERVGPADSTAEPRPAISRRVGGGEQLNVVI